MSLPDSGYIEINDTDSVIRGVMAGTTGTFSGTFSSLSVNAIEGINIRDGAVSAYYAYTFPYGSGRCTFTVPNQPYTQIADIIIPAAIYAESDFTVTATIRIEKNGVEVASVTMSHYGYMLSYLQSIRYVDFDVTEESTYEVLVYDSNYFKVDMTGRITVGFRKK